jgi:sulfur carrier protein
LGKSTRYLQGVGDPVRFTINGTTRDLEKKTESPGAPFTLTVLLAALDLSTRRVAVEVNGKIVPRAHHEKHALAEGDVIEVVTLVGGG